MAHQDDLTWVNWSNIASRHAKQLSASVREGMEARQEYWQWRDGRDDATIATALGISEAQATDLRLAFAAMKESHDALNNVAVTTADRMPDLRKFTGA